MSSAPSVSSSITARLHVEARPTVVSELTTAIEGAGGPDASPAVDDRLAGLAPAVAQRFEMAAGWIALARDDLETARRHLGSAGAHFCTAGDYSY